MAEKMEVKGLGSKMDFRFLLTEESAGGEDGSGGEQEMDAPRENFVEPTTPCSLRLIT
jgi:hypothetical protein